MNNRIPLPRKPVIPPRPVAPPPKPVTPPPKPVTPPPRPVTPPPRPVTPPPKLVSPLPKPVVPLPKPAPPMITTQPKPINMPITGSPPSSEKKPAPSLPGLPVSGNTNPSIKSTFNTVSTSNKLNETQSVLVSELKSLEDQIGINIRNINELTNQTNVVLSEIKELESETYTKINNPDNIGRANEISDRVISLEKMIKTNIKSKPIVELLQTRLQNLYKDVTKKIKDIKYSDKGISDLLPSVIADIILTIVGILFYIIPILIISVILIYIIFSETENAVSIREWFSNLFNFGSKNEAE